MYTIDWWCPLVQAWCALVQALLILRCLQIKILPQLLTVFAERPIIPPLAGAGEGVNAVDTLAPILTDHALTIIIDWV